MTPTHTHTHTHIHTHTQQNALPHRVAVLRVDRGTQPPGRRVAVSQNVLNVLLRLLHHRGRRARRGRVGVGVLVVVDAPCGGHRVLTSVVEQEGERHDAVQPIGRALVQPAVAAAADPGRVLDVVPELRGRAVGVG